MISPKEAIELLKKGHVVALPTETVYGVAARYDSKEGIEALYQIKGRPKNKALTVNLHAVEEIHQFLPYLPRGFDLLTHAYWPGPLTLVVDIKEEMILPDIRSEGSACGFRIPDHALTRAIIKAVGPIVLPSANLSGESPATTAQQVQEIFSIPVVDGGECKIGIASTVLAFKNGFWHVLREGTISKQSLTNILGYTP